jgi:hypothetical protein
MALIMFLALIQTGRAQFAKPGYMDQIEERLLGEPSPGDLLRTCVFAIPIGMIRDLELVARALTISIVPCWDPIYVLLFRSLSGLNGLFHLLFILFEFGIAPCFFSLALPFNAVTLVCSPLILFIYALGEVSYWIPQLAFSRAVAMIVFLLVFLFVVTPPFILLMLLAALAIPVGMLLLPVGLLLEIPWILLSWIILLITFVFRVPIRGVINSAKLAVDGVLGSVEAFLFSRL